MQDFPFVPNVPDSAKRQLKEMPGAQRYFWINQHCSLALPQQGGVAQLYNLAEYGATGDSQEFVHTTLPPPQSENNPAYG